MIRDSRAALFLAVWLFIPGCTDSQQSATMPAATIRAGQAVTPSPAQVEALIEQLAISQEPAACAPASTPSHDTPAADARVTAFKAAQELRGYGKSAFPYLLKHLRDNRQSVAFRRTTDHTVGQACFCIIESQILLLPSDYQGSIFRRGADGQLHERPVFSKPGLFTMETVEAWLAERQDKSLEQMQVEALQWLIAEEKRIGFASREDRKCFLYPLQRQIARITKQTHLQ